MKAWKAAVRGLSWCMLVACAAATPAQEDVDVEADASSEVAEDEPELSVTEHEVVIGGDPVPYRATAGLLRLKEDGRAPKADVFFVYYERTGEEIGERPVAFCFNGGPGSSSVWLHMGAFGPKRVRMEEGNGVPRPPFELVENAESLLDVTDLVFVDPPTTGYSRAVEGEDDGQFHGVEEDVRWMAEFVRLFVTRFGRWASPKLLAGESYGTTRVAGLAGELQDRHGMYLNGLVLVSSILRFQTARFDRGNDLPYPLFLPTYTATAWYHGRLAPELQADLRATLDEVEAFALGDYAAALMAGDELDDERRRSVAGRLARYTGLSVEFVEQADLRVSLRRFVKELLRDRGQTVGRLDSRYLGRDRDAAGESFEYDPSYAVIHGPYTAALNHYVRAELGYESDVPYEILTPRVHPWKWGETNDNRYVDLAETLRRAMTKNPHLRVFVANGYYDAATPYFATEYTFDHLGLAPELRGNVTMGHYEAGHMMYVHEPSLAALKSDLAEFVGEATGR